MHQSLEKLRGLVWIKTGLKDFFGRSLEFSTVWIDSYSASYFSILDIAQNQINLKIVLLIY